MSTDDIRQSISIKGRKIVNVFAGPGQRRVIVATIPKNVLVQFEMFSEDELGMVESRLLETEYSGAPGRNGV
jgi:hypothetical protein